MKKFMAIVAICALVFSTFCACTDNSFDGSDTVVTEETSEILEESSSIENESVDLEESVAESVE